MVRVIPPVLAAVALALLPAAVWPERHVLAAGAAAGVLALAGMLIPSLATALAGAVVAMLVFAGASMIRPPGQTVIPAFVMGAVVLVILDLADWRRRFIGAGVETGVWSVHLAEVGRTLALAALAAIVAVLVAPLLAATGLVIRLVLAVSGGLLAVTTVTYALSKSGALNKSGPGD